MLTLEFRSRDDFDEPKLEHRRLFSELLGTFMLVLVAAGAGILHAKGQINVAPAVVAPGLMVAAIILFMGAVSGAHLNPAAVSLAFAARSDFPWKRVPSYIIVQLLGAALACLVPARGVRQRRAPRRDAARTGLCAVAGVPDGDLLTAGLLSVIFGTASGAQNVGRIGALGVGGLHRFCGPVVGAGERHLVRGDSRRGSRVVSAASD